MKTTLIKEILVSEPDGREVTIYGWVRTKRETKNLVFVQINDGSCFASIQATYDRDAGKNPAVETELKRISTGASVQVTGKLIASPGSGQAVEVSVQSLIVLGEAPADTYPLQKKNHSLEFREIAHLRARTNTFGAVARVRSQMAYAINTFYYERGFHYVHTPIITTSDAEGAGEMFQVTTLDLEGIAKAGPSKTSCGTGAIDYCRDFFGKHASLTVSGQLEAETYALALSRVYTFGPTFRAENSNTTRHLANFGW